MTANTMPRRGNAYRDSTDPAAGGEPLPAAVAVDAAHDHVARLALRDTVRSDVGLELEFHLVDLTNPGRRPGWDEVTRLVAELPALPSRSAVTTEPGGQLELSSPPRADVAAAVAALRADETVLADALAERHYGVAPLGADPARPVARVNPAARYAAMEQHFDAVSDAASGRAMMAATAALQVNLDAGPAAGWATRWDLVHALGPVMIAMTACSPLLAGRSSGWRSMRQEVWHGLDVARTGPSRTPGSPAEAWARYALAAPVMLLREGDAARAVTERVPLYAWLAGEADLGRRPTLADVDYHLTTLFPPVRPRGYVEIRYLDALPERWWPAAATVTATLLDDPVAADRAAEICEPLRGTWVPAARDGLADPALRRAAHGIVTLAESRCPAAAKPDVAAFAELVVAGRSPGDLLRERAEQTDPVTVLEEVAREHHP